ncbi:hypothetical protein [Microbacterium galbinum]|uniref:Uncharacterized protein n=1 Tax=Microbacterium galbinum TaxID=2851646 RepID=A0ABY4ILR6_9MICO|nr:hypothetical protein [Microbacterium galbinum]UPL13032.1 hypothetical protein KV396_00345 [Microbacterium galbinum]
MSTHAPTTEEIRDYIRAADRVTAHMFSADAPDAVEAFDRWLAARDAEVRASVVVGEPEWEWGYRLVGDDGNVYKTGFAYDNPEEPAARGKMRAAEENEFHEEAGMPRLRPELIRRQKAGPWVQVDLNGAGS